MSAKIRICLMAVTYGRDKVKMKEILPYLNKRVDPKVAVRTFHRARKNAEEFPLAEQIRIGTRKRVVEVINGARNEGVIDYTLVREGGEQADLENLEIFLTDKGKELQKSNRVWQELVRAQKQGWMKISVSVELVKGDEE
jgi:hypothetical protein